jgi:protein TonB
MLDAAHPQSEIAAMQVPQAPDVANLDTQPAPPPPAGKPPPPKPKPEPRQTPQNKPKAKPAGKAQAASSGRAAQKAAGSGGGQVAGQKGADKAVSSGQRKSLMAKWGARIRSQVERRKRSPAGGAKGTVVLRLKVARSGHLQSVSVRKSSGHSALDAAAIAAVKRVRKFPAAPKGLTDQSYGFSLPIKFGQ